MRFISNKARRDLPGGDEPQGGFVDEAPPRPGHQPEVRVVSRTPHSRGVEGGRRSVRWSGRGRRGLYRRQAQEHAEVQARGDEGRRFPRGKDHRRRRQGSTDQQGERGRGRGHGRLDAPELRRGPGHRRRQGLHRRARVLARVDLPRSRERQPLEGRVCAGRPATPRQRTASSARR